MNRVDAYSSDHVRDEGCSSYCLVVCIGRSTTMIQPVTKVVENILCRYPPKIWWSNGTPPPARHDVVVVTSRVTFFLVVFCSWCCAVVVLCQFFRAVYCQAITVTEIDNMIPAVIIVLPDADTARGCSCCAQPWEFWCARPSSCIMVIIKKFVILYLSVKQWLRILVRMFESYHPHSKR